MLGRGCEMPRIWHFAEWVNCCLTVWFLIFLGIRVIFCFFIKILNFVCLCSGQAWWCGQRGTSRAPTGKKFFRNQSFEEALEHWSFAHLVDQVDILIRNRSGSYFAKVAAATRSLDSTRPVGILSALEHRQIFKYQPGLDWPWRYIKYINIKGDPGDECGLGPRPGKPTFWHNRHQPILWVVQRPRVGQPPLI